VLLVPHFSCLVLCELDKMVELVQENLSWHECSLVGRTARYIGFLVTVGCGFTFSINGLDLYQSYCRRMIETCHSCHSVCFLHYKRMREAFNISFAKTQIDMNNFVYLTAKLHNYITLVQLLLLVSKGYHWNETQVLGNHCTRVTIQSTNKVTPQCLTG